MPDHVIEVREPGAAARRVAVTGSLDIGREGVDLQLEDDQVSRHHLRLSVRDDALVVEDLGTTNGTRVNGTRIDGAVVIRPGDRVRIGRTEIEFLQPAFAPPQMPTAPAVPVAAPAETAPTPARPALDDLDARDAGAAIVRFRKGTAGERAVEGVVSAVRRARKRLVGFGSEPWGTKPQIVLVDPFADPDQPGQVLTSGTIVDVGGGQIWMVVSPESPPEDPERPLALLFGSAFAAAGELQFLLEGYGLVLAETPDPDPTLREIGRPPLAAAEGQLAAAMARSFVAYLIDRDGRDAFLRLLATAQPGQVEQTARGIFGAGLASLEEQWSRKLDAGAPNVKAGQFLRLTTSYLRPHVRRQIEIFFYMLLGLGFTMVFPFAFQRLLDEAIPSGEFSEVMSILGVLAVFFAISLLADLRRGYVSAYVGSAIVRRVRTEMFERLQSLSSRWFAQRQQGEILSRLFSDVGQMEAGVSQALREGLFQLLSLVVSSIVLLTLDPLLAVIVIAAAPVVAIVYKLMSKGAQKRSVALQEELGSVFDVAGENYSGQQVVKAFALESRENARFKQASDRLFTRQLRLQLFGGMFGLAVNGIVTLLRLVVLGLGSWMILEGDMTIGTLVAFMSIMGQVISPVTTLTSLGQDIQAATGSLIRINEVLEAVPDIAEDPQAPSLPPLSREIRLTGVGFSYTSERRTLDGVDCVIRAGQRVAFVGPTGAGKSSVLQLLQRFYDVDEGAVLFDGQDIRTVKLSSLRGQLGVVFQESFLFDTTIRENIGMGSPGASDEAIEAAARAAELHDSIMAMPRGYATNVGERGGRLSGGQRQRLAIARALVRDPRVLLLDEATSALDPRTERMISATLERVGEGRTTISVTHRLTSITTYDRIFVIVAGRLVEAGTHDELLATNGVYAELWAEQVGGRVVTEAPFDIAAALAALPLFAGLSRDDLAPAVARVTALELNAGETVPEGGGRLAIIRRGRARVLVPGLTGVSQESAVLGTGDAFGLAAVLGHESGAVLEAVEPTKLVVLDDAAISSLAAMHPSVAEALTGAGRARSAAPAGAIRLSRVTLGPGARVAPLSAVTDAAREARRASGTFPAVRP